MNPVVNSYFSGAGLMDIGTKQSRPGQSTHGLSRTPEYRVWQQMRLRCTDPQHKAYPNYGARGITVCHQWLESPEQFLADMGPKPSPAHEIDRIDNNKGYEPGNCRWATRSANDRNRRSSRMITAFGETLNLVAWAERFGIREATITGRLEMGWPAERAVSERPRDNKALRSAQPERRPCPGCAAVDTSSALCRACTIKNRPLSQRGFLAAPQYKESQP